MAYGVFTSHAVPVEELTGYSPDTFAASGDPIAHIRAILAVHPMHEHELRQVLADNDAGWEVVERLQAAGDIRAVEYRGQ